jgi:hypothetical protein
LNGEAGDVVAPAGNPVSVTAAEPVNPLRPVIEALKVELDVPAPVVIAFGDSAILKSCTALTVNVSAAEWVRDPELPVALTV